MKLAYVSLLLLAGWWLCPAGALGSRNIECDLVLCHNVVNNLPRQIDKIFNTGSKIYAYLSVTDIKNGVHKIEFYWYNRKGGQESLFSREVTVRDNSHVIWSWLKLKEPEVLYDMSFPGRWKVKVYIDGDYAAEEYFRVT